MSETTDVKHTPMSWYPELCSGKDSGEDYCTECDHYHVKDLKQFPESPCAEDNCECGRS